MARSDTSQRLSRLEQIQGMLKATDHLTVAELASELGVSPRTLNRDLRLLRDNGVPIESDRGRGGGLRLQRNWSLGRLHLSPAEAIDLLLSMAIAEQLDSPLLLQQLTTIKRKLSAAFAEAYQPSIRSLRRRIFVGRGASERVLANFQPTRRGTLQGIAEAFFSMKCIGIEYSDAKGAITYREIEPQFLYLSVPVWYVLAWDRKRGEIRSFRADRIRQLSLFEAGFRPKDPRPFLLQVETEIQAL